MAPRKRWIFFLRKIENPVGRHRRVIRGHVATRPSTSGSERPQINKIIVERKGAHMHLEMMERAKTTNKLLRPEHAGHFASLDRSAHYVGTRWYSRRLFA